MIGPRWLQNLQRVCSQDAHMSSYVTFFRVNFRTFYCRGHMRTLLVKWTSKRVACGKGLNGNASCPVRTNSLLLKIVHWYNYFAYENGDFPFFFGELIPESSKPSAGSPAIERRTGPCAARKNLTLLERLVEAVDFSKGKEIENKRTVYLSINIYIYFYYYYILLLQYFIIIYINLHISIYP